MRVLVTGCAGFLGQQVVSDLVELGHQVVGIDRDPISGAFDFILHDLRSSLIIPNDHVDVCVHLASEVGGFIHNARSRNLERNELQILMQVSALCQQLHCQRIIYTSSINVFEVDAEYNQGPLRRLRQRTPYARAKALAERYIEQSFSEYVIVRPTNLFGRAQCRRGVHAGESHVIPDLLRKIEHCQDLEILGDGKQVRNFIHVSDVSSFIVASLIGPERLHVNLRSGIQLSIGELGEQLMNITRTKRNTVFRPEYLRFEPHPIEQFSLPSMGNRVWSTKIDTLAAGLS